MRTLIYTTIIAAAIAAFFFLSENNKEIWQPAPGTTWQIQYTESLDTSVPADVYFIDLFDTTKDSIEELHAKERRVVCYISAGSYEDWRPDADDFPESVKGRNLDNWPGERWLDIRQLDVLRPIMKNRLDLAEEKGCDGVDPDNVDGYTNNTGFDLSAEDQLAYNKFLADAAHKRGLSIGLKNNLNQIPELVDEFDFAVNEQCFMYNECSKITPFIAQDKAVFHVEYELKKDTFCRRANQYGFSSIRKKIWLDSWRESCR